MEQIESKYKKKKKNDITLWYSDYPGHDVPVDQKTAFFKSIVSKVMKNKAKFDKS
jgi:transcription termination factor NusB